MIDYNVDNFTVLLYTSDDRCEYLKDLVTMHFPGVIVLDNPLVKMTIQEVDDFIFSPDSEFRKFYGDNYNTAHQKFLLYCRNMSQRLFMFSKIEDEKMRMAIERTIIKCDKFYGMYIEGLNNKDVLIIDDNMVDESDLCDSISACYAPGKISVIKSSELL